MSESGTGVKVGAAGKDLSQPKVVVIMPAYNAAKTLEKTHGDLPKEIVDLVILVDDASQDETADIASSRS
jgi:glycosyltransferase involved in cell wall biosynthesis